MPASNIGHIIPYTQSDELREHLKSIGGGSRTITADEFHMLQTLAEKCGYEPAKEMTLESVNSLITEVITTPEPRTGVPINIPSGLRNSGIKAPQRRAENSTPGPVREVINTDRDGVRFETYSQRVGRERREAAAAASAPVSAVVAETAQQRKNRLARQRRAEAKASAA